MFGLPRTRTTGKQTGEPLCRIGPEPHQSPPPRSIEGQCDEVVTRRELGSSEERAIDRVLLAFFTELHDATGYARPEALGGFPPLRPHTPKAS